MMIHSRKNVQAPVGVLAQQFPDRFNGGHQVPVSVNTKDLDVFREATEIQGCIVAIYDFPQR